MRAWVRGANESADSFCARALKESLCAAVLSEGSEGRASRSARIRERGGGCGKRVSKSSSSLR